MADKNNNEDSGYPRLYTMHSQKGGVGKTSIALAVAGLENILNKKRVVVIDMDMTGASLIDIYSKNKEKNKKYFNDLLFAEPHDFATYTPICRESNHSSANKENVILPLFCHKVQIDALSIRYIPASPLLKDILKVVPLISQENHLHFFKHRLEDIISILWDDFDVIIIDNPPGLFGISRASLDMVIDGANSTNYSRLNRIYFGKESGSDNKLIKRKRGQIYLPRLGL